MAAGIRLIKALCKALVALIRQAGDQIQVDVDVAHVRQAAGSLKHVFRVDMTGDGGKRRGMGALQTDLQLHLTRGQRSQRRIPVFVKQTGANAGNSPWWLRSMGQGSNSAVYVKEDGNILFKGIDVDYYSNGVRPVMWVSLDALK